MKKDVTKSIYETVKLMLNGGASVQECAEHTGFTNTTIYYIRKSKTFDEYKLLAGSGVYRDSLKNEQTKWEKAEDSLLLDKTTLALNNICGNLRFLIMEQKKTNELLSRIVNDLTR